jgi:SAM-dependent methyltransferase
MPAGNFTLIKGIHYRSRTVYHGLTFLKLGSDVNKRFHLACRHIKPFDSVLDLCCGDGKLKDLLPEGCRYHGVEASEGFVGELKKRNISHTFADLHEGVASYAFKADIALMIISLYHFKKIAALRLLEELKSVAKKIVIVEDVLEKPRSSKNFVQKAMNYFCQTSYYQPTSLLTQKEFCDVMDKTGYNVKQIDQRYFIGVYEN